MNIYRTKFRSLESTHFLAANLNLVLIGAGMLFSTITFSRVSNNDQIGSMVERPPPIKIRERKVVGSSPMLVVVYFAFLRECSSSLILLPLLV